MLNRQTLLDIVKKGGYEGNPDLEAIKKWAGEVQFEIQGDDGSPVDLDAAWAEKAVVRLPKPEPKANAATRVDSATSVTAPAVHTNPGRRLYKSWVEAGRNPHTGEETVYRDPDEAEVSGAALRLSFCAGVGIGEYAQKSRDIEIVGKAMATSPDSVGGGLVPIELSTTLIELKDRYGLARRLIGTIQSSSGQLFFPRVGTDVTVYAVGEAAAITESTPTVTPVSASVKKFGALSYISSEMLIAPAVSAVDMIARSHTRALAQKEDQCFFNGDGTATYNGMVGLKNSLGAAAIVQGSGNAWSAITDNDINKFVGNIEENAHVDGTVSIACSTQAFFQIFATLAGNKGGVTMMEAQNGKLMYNWRGWKVDVSSVLPTATATNTIFAYSGAFSRGCKFVERTGGTRFAASEHYRFANDQIAYRTVEEIDIVCHDVGDSSNLGQVSALKTSS